LELSKRGFIGSECVEGDPREEPQGGSKKEKKDEDKGRLRKKKKERALRRIQVGPSLRPKGSAPSFGQAGLGCWTYAGEKRDEERGRLQLLPGQTQTERRQAE
jgi:hypothetical protein